MTVFSQKPLLLWRAVGDIAATVFGEGQSPADTRSICCGRDIVLADAALQRLNVGLKPAGERHDR